MRMNTDGLILKVTDVGESDRVVTVLTKDYGVLRAYANGAKKIKSRSQSATQPLCYSRLSIYKNRDSYIIDEAQSIESFFRLRDNIENLSLAQYFCELAGELAPEMDEAADFLRVTLNCLHMLVTGKRTQLFLKAVAELRLLTLAGYMPDLSVCSRCGKEPAEGVGFLPESGTVVCPACGHTGIALSPGVLCAMRHICTAPDEKLFAFQMPEESLKRLSEISERYLLVQTGRRYKALDFYRSLF